MVLNEILAFQQIGFPVLTSLVFMPVAVLVGMSFVRDERLAYRIGIGAAVFELLLALLVVGQEFVAHSADVQFAERGGTLPLLGIEYHLGVDGISALFVPLTALLTLLAMLYAEPAMKVDTRRYLMALLGFEATMMGAFVSLDLMLFWLFFVLELIPSYFLIAHCGTGEGRRHAAINYVAVMLAGSALMLVGILLLGVNAAKAGKPQIFDLLALLTIPVPASLQTLVFFLLFFGFAIKAPVFPFHTWMPRVLEQGPVVGVSVFLVGLKIGTYGFLRFVIPLLPEAAKEWFWLMALLGAVGMVYGALIALVQTNLRRLLAFASLSHMGVVMLGLASLNFTGFQGGLLQMINLGIAGAGLFFIAGFLYTRLGPPDLCVMGGLGSRLPALAMTFLVIGLASIGLPGTGGFNGEHLVMIGAFQAHWSMALLAGIGTILTATYFFWYYLRAFMGAPNPRTPQPLPDIRRREILIAATLGLLIFWIGFYTGPFLQTMSGSLQALAERVERGSPPLEQRAISPPPPARGVAAIRGAP